MPVPAIELRPRGAIHLVDAALRLCARRVEPWSLALPGGALVALAVTFWVDALQSGRRVVPATLVLTAAWLARAVFQAAASDWVQRFVVAPEEPTVRSSLGTALAHLPTLAITTVMLLLVNLITLPATLGIAAFFLTAHVAAYAVALQEAGHPLAIHATCSRVLGNARNSTTGVRVALWLVVLMAVNLHVAANAFIYLGRKLAGLELTFAQRYASLDNLPWVVVMLALAFALFEPLRATAAALLVVDGRVRQDGVDLQTALQQLPPRGARRAGPPRAAVLLLVACAALGAAPAAAQPDEPPTHAQIEKRLVEAARDCELLDGPLRRQISEVRRVGPAERSALSRYLREIERAAYDDGDCEVVEARLHNGLALIGEAADGLEGPGPADAAEQARRILARPEFAQAPEQVVEETAPRPEEDEPDAPPSWWEDFKRWLREKIADWLRRDRTAPGIPMGAASGDLFARALVVVLGAVVLAVLVWLVLRLRERGSQAPQELEVTGGAAAEGDAEHLGALARPPEGWAHLADELAARGEHREAVRHLYLAVLSRLHRDGAIDYDPALSNWDYLRRFRGPDGWRSALRELTFRFDYAYYGRAEVGPGGYRQFRALCAPVLEAPVAPERRAG